MPAAGVVLMFLALSKFVAAVYNSDDAMFNDILDGCHGALKERGMVTNAKAESLLLSLLQVPLQVCMRATPSHADTLLHCRGLFQAVYASSSLIGL